MLSYFISAFRAAKVQAELMAQINNQELVNEICHQTKVLQLIDYLFKNAYYRKRKDASFLIVCAILVMIINDHEISHEQKEASYLILKQRLDRIKINKQYCLDNFLVIGDCEEAVASWERHSYRD